MSKTPYQKWNEGLGSKPGFLHRYESFMKNVEGFAQKHNISLVAAMSIIEDLQSVKKFYNCVEIDSYFVEWGFRGERCADEICRRYFPPLDVIPDGFEPLLEATLQKEDGITAGDVHDNEEFSRICHWIDLKVPEYFAKEDMSYSKVFVFGEHRFMLSVFYGQGTYYAIEQIGDVLGGGEPFEIERGKDDQ